MSRGQTLYDLLAVVCVRARVRACVSTEIEGRKRRREKGVVLWRRKSFEG
jgi:hypothetical protein